MARQLRYEMRGSPPKGACAASSTPRHIRPMTKSLTFTFEAINRKRPWQSFAASYVLQAVLVALLVRIAMVAPKVLAPHDYKSISLYLPVQQVNAPPKVTAPVRHIQPPPRVAIQRLAPPKLELPKEAAPPVVAKVTPPEIKPVEPV